MAKVLLFLLLLISGQFCVARELELVSPDGKTRLIVEVSNGVHYSLYYDNKLLIARSQVDFILANGIHLGEKLRIRTATRLSNHSFIHSFIPEKRINIPDNYNQLTIRFGQPMSIQWRLYDDGFAYRFQTFAKDSIIIQNEVAEFNFPDRPMLYYPQVVKRDNADIFHTSFEEPYQHKPMDSLQPGAICFSPVLVEAVDGPKLSLTESDIADYPGMFLEGTSGSSLHGRFAPYPLEEKIADGEFPQAIVSVRANYIARTIGTRSYPWRVLMIAPHDKDLPANDLVYRLATPSKIGDVSWIQPGKGTDEWIIGVNLFNVAFKTGVNTASYKYYIDFAKRFGFQRIMMDAGWSDAKDLFKINSEIDMNEIATYAKKQGIRLSMWTLALTLDRQLEAALDQFNKWGVDFIMTDFMDRDDQQMVNFYTRVAEACARHKIMIMYHGAFKPAGFGRTWPNAITREAVLGSEYNIWSEKANPEHDLLLPFIRMTAGPMDYEPGLLQNASAKTFRPIGDNPMSLGTRCHQAAMFIVYDSPMQLFSGNPSQGYLEPAFMEFIGNIPTTWDSTIIVDAKVGDYIITARRKGKDWYIGAMTDWTARELALPLDFIGAGEFTATSIVDGMNADRYAADHVISTETLTASSNIKIRLSPGGGYILHLQKKN